MGGWPANIAPPFSPRQVDMNLVGKIFVVVIFVMSLVFMTLAMMVYAMHKNWRDVVVNEKEEPGKPLGLSRRLQDEQAHNKALADQLDKLKQQVEAEPG